MSGEVIFVGGIDTEIGKTVVTGWLARQWIEQGREVITQKLVQTGCVGASDDILLHRRLMGSGLFDEDRDGTTMPALYAYPASPHLAAKLESRALDLDAIAAATARLRARYDTVLVEGAGGLLVPLTAELLTLDYVAAQGWPVILVTSGRLGSINHTLLSLEAIAARGIALHGIAWNSRDDGSDEVIAAESRRYLRQWMQARFPQARWYDVPVLMLD
ncbi:MAG: ATP-dependent dethiobiotin synthetase BioD [Stenotrophomonas nitritireducens]|uniref:dethiobiotin synthase n=1 Tax=Stenotrophomonas nitritireducens TaxID=83617 RepID=UPI001AC9789C|nr:dethiobiotin synthase [Stenotrophomonas nitritireducens]MBN8791597.1 ATP-dependent dethiobiotin synthetase BioD [Stenotrophomonas nitritireducens]MBN8795535.1 ATP-dependent dethiobiotin synthetase BioD [Stenotrophomonas nitritireducens]